VMARRPTKPEPDVDFDPASISRGLIEAATGLDMSVSDPAVLMHAAALFGLIAVLDRFLAVVEREGKAAQAAGEVKP
jgi:hypothetical protein